MFKKIYDNNFVRASSPEGSDITNYREPVLSGEEARRIYLEVIKDARSSFQPTINKYIASKKRKYIADEEEDVPLSKKELFLTVQNNNIAKLKLILDKNPNVINIVDNYGWSLLMIACQANSIDCAKELLRRGIDINVRDKAGNSARSLVIKNKYYELADVLLKYNESTNELNSTQETNQSPLLEKYLCDVCNKMVPDRAEHLSSTLHNISASKGKKLSVNYVIPASNKGYQLMLKAGWDKDSGLGRDGSGNKYPIKTVPKKDRKGLGIKKKKDKISAIEEERLEDNIKYKSKKMFADNYKKSRSFEINFRRQFY